MSLKIMKNVTLSEVKMSCVCVHRGHLLIKKHCPPITRNNLSIEGTLAVL